MTRGEFALMLLRLKRGANYEPPAATGIYGDVPTDHPAAAWIERLADEDITQGCGASSFCPSQAVTRDQLAVLLSRTLELAL